MRVSNKFLLAVTTFVIFPMIVLLIACKKDSSVNPLSGDLQSALSTEATLDSDEDEIDDITSSQLSAASNIPGRVQTITDERVACAKITVLVGDKQGKLIINFDSTTTASAPTGCKDTQGNVRKGQILIEWHGGNWYSAGSEITVTPNNYSVNGLVINGSRVLTNITDLASPKIIIWTVFADHNFLWSDGTTAVRTVNKTKFWDTQQGTVKVTQSAGSDNAVNGTNRQGKNYTVVISNPILYTVECAGASKVFLPVSGTKIFTLVDSNTVLTFDFGSGTCDNTFTVTYEGFTETVGGNNSGS